MNIYRQSLLVMISFAAALLLAGCGSPDPIPVFVTPTPVKEPTATAAPVAEAPGTTLVGGLPVPGMQVTPLPTPLPPPPGVTFGPIIAPNYTPEPLHTPLPSRVSVRPCRAQVVAAQTTLYQNPDQGSLALSTAFERDWLVVTQVNTDAAGNRWAATPEGWLLLSAAGVDSARLDSIYACEVLTGQMPRTTLLGLHVLHGNNRQDVVNFAQRLVNAGIPLGTLKGLNGAEALLTEVKQLSPQTITVYRSILNGDGVGDCPADVGEDIGELPDPVRTAQRWMAGLDPYWDQLNADYYELMNECSATLSWIAQFSIESMRIANEQGRCLLLFSFPGGNPDMQQFDELLPAYQYALDHPCQPGRLHSIALHSWSLEDTRLTSETDVWIAFRHRILYERLLLTLPDAANLPIYLTEMGIGGGTFLPPCDWIVRDALQYTYQIEEDPYVKGFHLWNVGSGAQWYDITPCLSQLADAVIRYYGG